MWQHIARRNHWTVRQYKIQEKNIEKSDKIYSKDERECDITIQLKTMHAKSVY